MAFGVIDIGTNSVLLLVAQVSAGQSIQTLHDECRIMRLGEGLNSHCEFQSAAMDRTMSTLHDFKTTCIRLHCDSIHAVGTAGFRMAKNAEVFIQRVSNEMGIQIKVIDGKEEARLIYLSCQHDFGHLGDIAVLDIGGGSTEIVTSQELTSLPFGVVTLTEKFIHSDPPTKSEIGNLNTFVNSHLKHYSPHRGGSYPDDVLSTRGSPILVTTAGTPTTLAALHLGLKAYDSAKVHGLRLTMNDLTQLKNRLEQLPLSERAKISCLPEKRADVIVAGVNILMTVMNFLNRDSILISDRGLRYGVLLAPQWVSFGVEKLL